MKLAGKTAVITGASRGLGRELALALAGEGCNLRLCARSEPDLKLVQKLALEAGAPSCLVFPMDLAARHDVPKLVEGRVDLLINNAAMAHTLKPIEQIAHLDMFRATWLNVYTPIKFMQAVIPGMKARKEGVIVNICSLAGRRGIKNLSIYSATKFALRGLTEAVAQELEGTGVVCFSVSPGGMSTQARVDLFGKEDAEKQQKPFQVAKLIISLLPSADNGVDYVIRKGTISWSMSPEKW